ncbi:MAG: hypothetical protein IJI07_09890 [Flexilinea sp.]|nr:hypothetical protein [Flexilinea sp.]
MIGKKKCEILKEIRQKIADENEIPYKTRQCTHQGPCSGTCPYCESEVRYLESQLKKRVSLGKPIKIAALATGVALAVSGCSVVDTIAGMMEPAKPTPEIEVLEGEVPYIEQVDPDPLPTVQEEAQNIEFDLTGYVAADNS